MRRHCSSFLFFGVALSALALVVGPRVAECQVGAAPPNRPEAAKTKPTTGGDPKAHKSPDGSSVADYNQWKLALTAGGVAQPVSLTTKPGFVVEIVRTAGPQEGSWISLTFDPKGRAVIGREDKGLLRLTLAESSARKADSREKAAAAPHDPVARVESIEKTLLEPRGLLFAHDSLYGPANNSKGLYRLRDTDNDDRFDETTLLRRTEGGVGHGRNGLALGPDGMIYMALGNNVEVPKDVSPKSPYRNYGTDRLLPCVWNEFLFDAGVVPPAGHIARTDADGKTWELFAGGFRNPYDLAFLPNGELFTYDADMEWDAGAPWYRPTCVMHVVSGGEYGWRQGASVWPDGFADMLPRVADVGLGSPTGVVFGHGTKFPEPYRSALFILDWAYGRILAVHLTEKGASYQGRVEPFVKGKPLNVTDAAVGPDGALYFTVGGRRTQSALYRVRWTGDVEPPKPVASDTAAAAERARMVRHHLEAAHSDPRLLPIPMRVGPDRFEIVRESLKSRDPFLQHAARVALERAATERPAVEPTPSRMIHEHDVDVALQASLALARTGDVSTQPALFQRLAELLAQPLSADQRRVAWRAAQLACIRMGQPDKDEAAAFVKRLEAVPLDVEFAEQQLLCELHGAFPSKAAVARGLHLLETGATQEQKLFSLFVLRNHTSGWTLDTRRRYFEGLRAAERFRGAQYMARFVTYIRTDALASLSNEERVALRETLGRLGKADVAVEPPAPPRPFVKMWTMDDLVPRLDEVGKSSDPVRGRALFAAARCRDCHRLGSDGAPIGPDLAGVASRFSRRDLLETILHPSKVVDDKYRNLILETDNGEVITGGLAGGDAQTLAISVDPNEPTRLRRIARTSIEARRTSNVSPMPEGLLSTLTAEEILELLAYLDAASTGD